MVDVAWSAVGYIKDTRGEYCESGNCVQVCNFENLKLIPGTEEVNDGKCRRVQCHQDFSVTIRT